MPSLQVNGGIKVGNAVIPPEGPLAIPLQMNFASQSAYSVDVGMLMQKGPGFPGLSVIQTLFVDNSTGAGPTNVLVTNTQQTLIIPPGAQGYFPILSPSTGQIIFQNNNLGQVNADIINVPMPAMIWGGAGGASPQFDGQGRLITTDPALDALISDGALDVRGYDGPIPEAPIDGNTYGRKNAAWAQVAGGGGGGSISPFVPGELVAPAAADFTISYSAGFAGATVTGLNSGRGVNFGMPATEGFQIAYFGLNDYVPPAAGTDFTAQCLMAFNSQLDANWHVGLYFEDVNGYQQSFGIRNNQYSIFQYGGGGGQTNGNTCQNVQGPWWFRVSRIGETIQNFMSQDGESWSLVFNVSSTSFLAADITSVGFSAGWNSGGPQSISCFAFETSQP